MRQTSYFSIFFINFAYAWCALSIFYAHRLTKLNRMAKQRILFVSPEIAPYLPASNIASLGRDLPVAMHGRKYEVRTFMPDFGNVNERRNQLHEVIRLSGVNISIRDTDHPLIIKVASMQPSRIQVYFIDNDDYFQKLDDDADNIGSNRPDNGERVIFFSRGTVDTARKLRWEPNILHTSGWIAALVPLYAKKIFSDGVSFKETKIVYSILDENPAQHIDGNILDKLREDGISQDDLSAFEGMESNCNLLHKMGIANSDAVIFNNLTPDPELVEYAKQSGIPTLFLNPEEDNTDKYHEFYQSLLANEN